MFGGKKLKLLDAAISQAQAVSGSKDISKLQDALSSLRNIWGKSPTSDLDATAQHLITSLEKSINALTIRSESAGLSACSLCGNHVLLVSSVGHIDNLYIDNGSVHLKLRIIVCPSCGEMRFRAVDASELATLRNAVDQHVFSAVKVSSATEGPYR